MREIAKIDLDTIKDMVLNIKEYLRGIVDGSGPQERNNIYRHGTRQQQATLTCSMGYFTHDQEEVVVGTLSDLFMVHPRDEKGFDFVFKVLLTEVLVRIFMDTKKISYEDAERQLRIGEVRPTIARIKPFFKILIITYIYLYLLEQIYGGDAS